MSGFACMECGHRFKTVKAAERASFGPNGCPKCGGSDIDLAPPPAAAKPEARNLIDHYNDFCSERRRCEEKAS